MDEITLLTKMIAPGTRRPGKFLDGVIQILVTSSCTESCLNCTQASNVRRKPWFMTPDQFETAVKSLDGYFGVVGVFGGCPTISPHFADYCALLRKHVPFDRRGLWANDPVKPENAIEARNTFNPRHSNLNVHMNSTAYTMWKRYWPESLPCGLTGDSGHAPVHLSMRDVGLTESARNELISACDINQHWSAGVTALGDGPDDVYGFFCEIAMGQARYWYDLDRSKFVNTGLKVSAAYDQIWVDPVHKTRVVSGGRPWWKLPMPSFQEQVRQHCHDCGVPLRGLPANAKGTGPDDVNRVSAVYSDTYRPKKGTVALAVVEADAKSGGCGNVVRYLQNAKGK